MVQVNLKSESNVKPNKFAIENIINGKCDIVLIENIEEHSREDGDIYYTYDMYRIVKNNYRDKLESDLADDTKFSVWLDFAKEQYANQAEDVSIEERLSTAEAVIAEILNVEV